MSRPSNRPYFRAPNLGPDCSTQRSARLRERRFAMAYEGRAEPPEYTQLAEQAKRIYLEHEGGDTTASGLEMPDPFGAAPRLRPAGAGRRSPARPTER